MSNLAEGFERNRRTGFHQLLSTAKASCAEVHSQLHTACDISYIDKEAYEELLQQAEEASRISGGLRVSVEKQRDARK